MSAPTLPAVLATARDTVTPALRLAVGRCGDGVREVAGYHFGWLTADGRPADDDGGKALRPALALLSAEAVGAAPALAVPGAVAVELVHNFSLLHDDVMDRDTHRRHRPTAWTVFGDADAILAGDALLAAATEVLLDVATPAALRATTRLMHTSQRLITGQHHDVAFCSRDDVRLPECLSMAADKTGALLSCAAAIGAELAGAPAPVLAGLATYGEELGLAFQIADDLLGIWGDPATTGKPVGSDLRSRKKSLPVAAALARPGAGADELAALLLRDPLDDGDVARATELVELAGGRAWAQAEAQRRLDAACAALDPLPLDDGARAELHRLAEFTVRRTA